MTTKRQNNLAPPWDENKIKTVLKMKDATIRACMKRIEELEEEIAALKKPKRNPPTAPAVVASRPHSTKLPIGLQKTFGWL